MTSRYVSIENEILMYFRVLKKQANEVSLSEPIDGEDEGGALSIMDTISVPDTMAEDFDFAECSRSHAVETGRDDLRVIDDKGIARLKVIDHILERIVGDLAGHRVKMHKS